MAAEKPFISTLLDELNQDACPRQELLRKIGEVVGRTAVAYFTSFRYPVMIDDSDADMIEEVLQASTLENGLCLVLNSPGGEALAAERIVRTCREYSDGNFDVVIPRRAKSAATMIAFRGEQNLYGPYISSRADRHTNSQKRTRWNNGLVFSTRNNKEL